MSQRSKLALLFIAQAAFHVAWNIAWVAHHWFEQVDRAPINSTVMLTAPTYTDHIALVLYAVARVVFFTVLSAIVSSRLMKEIFGRHQES